MGNTMTERIIYEQSHIELKKAGEGMRFQERDFEILRTIYNNDGILAKRQLQLLFWPGMSTRAMEKRLSKLNHGEYLTWPSRDQWRSKPIPEPICWLGWKGILMVAGKRGKVIESPSRINENKLRKLENKLRDKGIHWMREPRWIQLEHDIAVTDFRLGVEQAVAELRSLTLEKWITDGTFRSSMDVIEYGVKGKDGALKTEKKGICPDGYFEISDERRRINGTPARARFLVEVDMSTHDNPSFGREKAVPGVAYIKSIAYKNRFGYNSGRWLIVTTGKVRMKNLTQQTIQSVGSGSKAFLFTTFEQLVGKNALTESIWTQPGNDKPISLFLNGPHNRTNLTLD
jgi:hypothetical protein